MALERPYSASTSAPGKSYLWPAISAALVAVVAYLYGSRQAPTAPAAPAAPIVAAAPAATTPPAAAAPAPAPTRAADEDSANLRSDNNRLRLALAQTEGERDAARAEAQRYKDGLERAVAQLNEQAARQSATPTYTPRSAPAPRGEPWITTWGTQLQSLGDRMIATATVRNSGSAAGGIRTVTFTLLENGRPIDTQRQQLDVGLRSSIPVTATFYRSPIDGQSYTARVDVE